MKSDDTPHANPFSDQLIIQALNSSPEATAIYTGEDMIIRFANEGMLAVWGKDVSVIGKPLLEAIPELEDQPFLSLLQEVWRSGKTYAVKDAPAELVKDGILIRDWYDYEYKALLDQDHKTWCILNTAKEVTSRREYLRKIEQKEEEEQALNEEMATTLEELTATNEELSRSLGMLAESREHVRTIIQQAPVGIAMLQGPDHVIEIANPTILKIWGREEADVVGQPHNIARPELAGQPVNQWLEDVYRNGERKTNNEFLVKLRQGEGLREAIVNSIYQPVFSNQGEVTGVLIILEEITQQVLDRRKSEKDQHMLSMAIDAGNLATFYYEPATNLFSGNALLKSWFGLSPTENLDLSLALEVIVGEDRERVGEAIRYSLSEKSDGHYAIEYRIRNAEDHQDRLVQARGRVFYDEQGVPSSLNGTLRDITVQKKDEQRKDDFIGMVSHELKTPLTSLKAYLQMLQRSAMLSENTSYQGTFEKSLRQVHKMNIMINGFLNVSRLDSAKMFIEKSEFDVFPFFEQLRDEMLSTITTHNLVFVQPGHLVLSADCEKIAQVIHNLVGNAVKYSPMGSTIRLGYEMADDSHLRVFISDEGMGISTEDQQQIFERYYRVSNVQTASIAGFGIGLYFCREIIELHGGKIEVDSTEGIGTTFRFLLPLGG